MIAVDTSVVIPAFASWHQGHAAARAVLRRSPRLPAHVALEAYSVLTRMSPPFRSPAPVVAEFLDRRFPQPLIALSAEAQRTLPRRLAGSGLIGGAIYDALVGLTAAEVGAVLVSRDARAASTYASLGISYELIPQR